MQPQVKRYAPPAAQWVNIVRNGHILFRFDKIRGIIEIKNRGEWLTVDLVAEIERWEQMESAKQIVS